MISDSKTTIQFSGGGISARKRAEMVFDGSGTRTDNGWVYVYASKKAVTFNTIQFREAAEAAGRIVVEVPDEAGGWRPIYRQDEIGRRTGVLDETVTADTVRATVDWDGDLPMESILLTTQQPVVRQRPFRVVSYYPFRPEDNRKNYDKLDVITDLILLPQIAYTSDGLLQFEEDRAQALEASLRELREQIGTRPINLWLCIGNPSAVSDKSRLFTDPAVRRRSIEQCLELTARCELCGVDIDYEYPDNEAQWRRYGVFLRELSDALKKEGRMLSTALSPWGIILQPEEIRCLDYVNIMAYDLGDKQGRHSTYTLADTSIAYFEKLGFSPSQLVLGLAFYGVSTIQVDAPHSGHPYARYVQQFGDRVKTDTNQVEDIYFTGRDMNRDKTLLAIHRGLSGVFYWNFACDIPYEDERCLLRGVGETSRRFTR